MPKTYGDLRNAIAAYMHRDPGTFVMTTSGADMLLRAVNNAKDFCQRAVDFESARVFAQLDNVSLQNGGSIDNCVLFGTATPVTLKQIDKVFLQSPAGVQFPIDFISRSSYVERLRRRFSHVQRLDDGDISSPASSFPLSMVQYGRVVYLVPSNSEVIGGASSFTAYFDGIQWLSDFTTTARTGSATSTLANKLVASAGNFIVNEVRIGDIVSNTTNGTSALVTSVDSATQLGLNADIFVNTNAYSIATVPSSQTNFLLDYAFDYMLFHSISELNFFLKEDQRVKISDTKLQTVWNNVLNWNATIVANSVQDVTLD